MSEALPCFCCGKELENVINGENQPYDGIEFFTYGHYGTAVFDHMDGSRLILNICDNCLWSNIDKTKTIPPRTT